MVSSDYFHINLYDTHLMKVYDPPRRVAAGKPLPDRFVQNPHVQPKGWAVESRVYAEDPLRGFLPSIGPLLTYKEPPLFDARSDKRPDGLTVRIDTGVYEGGVISMYYDPMIAKLVTHGRTRNEAIHVIHSHHYE